VKISNYNYSGKMDCPCRKLYLVLPVREYCELLHYIYCALVWTILVISQKHGVFLLAKVRWGIRITKHRSHWWKILSHRHGQKLLATLGCGSIYFLWGQYMSSYIVPRTSLYTIHSTVKIHHAFCIINSNLNFLFSLNAFKNPV
jgi:hypothetical protein